jgi:hypothetical protein
VISAHYSGESALESEYPMKVRVVFEESERVLYDLFLLRPCRGDEGSTREGVIIGPRVSKHLAAHRAGVPEPEQTAAALVFGVLPAATAGPAAEHVQSGMQVPAIGVCASLVETASCLAVRGYQRGAGDCEAGLSDRRPEPQLASLADFPAGGRV